MLIIKRCKRIQFVDVKRMSTKTFGTMPNFSWQISKYFCVFSGRGDRGGKFRADLNILAHPLSFHSIVVLSQLSCRWNDKARWPPHLPWYRQRSADWPPVPRPKRRLVSSTNWPHPVGVDGCVFPPREQRHPCQNGRKPTLRDDHSSAPKWMFSALNTFHN